MEIQDGTRSLAQRIRADAEKLQVLRALSPKYLTHRQPKPGGGFRVIAKPHPELLQMQRVILKRHLRHLLRTVSPYVHGGMRGRDYVTNALPHRRAEAALVIDLKSAYSQVTRERLHQTLRRAGSEGDTLECLLDLTVDDALGLPQGAATSNALFNLACHELDEALTQAAVREGMRYTRYVDELTISSRSEIPYALRARIVSTIESLGWRVNPRKVRYFEATHGALEITGVSVHDEKVTLPKRRIEELRTLLHRALTDSTITREVIEGKMSQVRRVYGKKLPRRLRRAYVKAYWAFRDHRRTQQKGEIHAEAPE